MNTLGAIERTGKFPVYVSPHTAEFKTDFMSKGERYEHFYTRPPRP